MYVFQYPWTKLKQFPNTQYVVKCMMNGEKAFFADQVAKLIQEHEVTLNAYSDEVTARLEAERELESAKKQSAIIIANLLKEKQKAEQVAANYMKALTIQVLKTDIETLKYKSRLPMSMRVESSDFDFIGAIERIREQIKEIEETWQSQE